MCNNAVKFGFLPVIFDSFMCTNVKYIVKNKII